jgi:hypothetical protein
MLGLIRDGLAKLGEMLVKLKPIVFRPLRLSAYL